MDKIINRIKSTRRNMWSDFKKFMKPEGYKYYEMPKELKFRYPAPGSVPRTQEERPNTFKPNWKTPWRDSVHNIRKKPLLENDRYGANAVVYSTENDPIELDPNNPKHAEVLQGPIRNRERVPDEQTYRRDTFAKDGRDDTEYRKKLQELFRSKDIYNALKEDIIPHNADMYDEYYSPEYLWFYERGTLECGQDPIMQHTFLSIEDFIENVLGKERIETQEMDMYKGTVKKWQVLDHEQFTDDQIDKVQNAIKAPLSGQLDKYKEDSDVKHPLPITNANASEWRDRRRAIDNADFNAKLIEFEQKRDKNYFMKRYERPKQLQ